MVLLPKPPVPKEPDTEIRRNIFFENDTMDHLSKHFIGNNFRLVQFNEIGGKHSRLKWVDITSKRNCNKSMDIST